MRTDLTFVAVFAIAAVAQTTSTAVGGFIGGIGSGNPIKPVTGHPYSAEQVMEHVQTLADGTHITQATQKVTYYRDSTGRTRTERTFTPPPGAVSASGRTFIEINDPVAGYRYTLDSHNQVARRMVWPPVPQQGNRAVPAPHAIMPVISSGPVQDRPVTVRSDSGSQRPRPQTTNESLGTQTIEGVTTQGTRITTTFPEGFVGNDRPITTITETWTSPELNVPVLSKTLDPRSGEITNKLINISLNEPDPSLFQVPAEYSVVDEQQPVVIQR